MAEMLTVEVAYATAEQQLLLSVTLPVGATVENAIVDSELDLSGFQNLTGLNVGIFGKVCALHQLLQQGDRVEIYRPLQHDPKEARRLRAIKR